MERLTNKRVNGIKQGYWTAAKKDELVERLAAYEDTGLTPEEIMDGKMLTGWILCSERLPEISGRYLISRTDYDGVNDKIVILVDVFDFDTENRYDAGFFATEVDAWQPLPEPWEGAKE